MTATPRVLLIAFLATILHAPSATSQIVNTLRGWDEQRMGWSGGTEGAVAVADGNTDYFEFELSAAVQHQTTANRWRFLGRLMRRTAYGTEIAESRMAHVRHNHRLTRHFSTLAFLQGQYEPFKRIEQRYLAGAGLSIDLREATDWNSIAGAAVMYENEELTDNRGQTTDDVRLSFFASVFRDVKEGVDVDVIAFYQPRVDAPGDARATVAAGIRADIVGSLYAVIRYAAEYDSDPAPGVDGLDQNLRAGLGYKF